MMNQWIKDGIDFDPMGSKVAKAVGQFAFWSDGTGLGDLTAPPFKQVMLRVALTVLESMRAPTIEMRKVSTFSMAEIEYRAMIDAAILETRNLLVVGGAASDQHRSGTT